jgi:hypothetical protein
MNYNYSKMSVTSNVIPVHSITNVKKKFACEAKDTKASTIKLGCTYIVLTSLCANFVLS